MPSFSGALSSNLSYIFVVVGLVWLGLAYLAGSLLLVWPVVAFMVGGALLKAMPSARLTAPWVGASTLMGVVLSSYQAYASYPLLGGQFTEFASISLVGFVVFAFAHLYLLAISRSGKRSSD